MCSFLYRSISLSAPPRNCNLSQNGFFNDILPNAGMRPGNHLMIVGHGRRGRQEYNNPKYMSNPLYRRMNNPCYEILFLQAIRWMEFFPSIQVDTLSPRAMTMALPKAGLQSFLQELQELQKFLRNERRFPNILPKPWGFSAFPS